MRKTLQILFLATIVLPVAACAHRAPKPVRLPTAAAVRAPIVEAKASNARAVQLAVHAKERGIVAGSAEAQELSAVTLATDGRLTDALAQVDKLTAQLLSAQKQVDEQTGKLAWYVEKYQEAVRSLWWYRLRFWGPLALAVAAVIIALLTRFTTWGARTFGPVFVKAAAMGAALA